MYIILLRLKKTEEKIAEYLKEMDQNDTADSDEDENMSMNLRRKYANLKRKSNDMSSFKIK